MKMKIISNKVNRAGVCRVLSMLILLLGFFSADAVSQDARSGVQSPQALLERAKAHKQKVVAEVEELSRKLEQDREAVETKLTQLRNEVKRLENTHAQLQEKLENRRTELKLQKEREREHNQQHAELLGSIRASAADVKGMVKNSPVTALEPHRDHSLVESLNAEAPGIQEVRTLRDLMLEQIEGASQVQREHIIIVNRAGKKVDAEVVLLGAFTAMYRSDTETGFALYSPPSRQLLALSQAPGYTLEKAIEVYMDGEREAAPIDIGHGASLRQMTYERSLGEQVQYGGSLCGPSWG